MSDEAQSSPPVQAEHKAEALAPTKDTNYIEQWKKIIDNPTNASILALSGWLVIYLASGNDLGILKADFLASIKSTPYMAFTVVITVISSLKLLAFLISKLNRPKPTISETTSKSSIDLGLSLMSIFGGLGLFFWFSTSVLIGLATAYPKLTPYLNYSGICLVVVLAIGIIYFSLEMLISGIKNIWKYFGR